MSWRDIRPVRFIMIGVLLLAPTAVLLLSLVLPGLLDPGFALAGFALVTAAVVVVLRMIMADSRTLADYADRVADAGGLVPPPEVRSTSAEVIAGAIARAQQRWLIREQAAGADAAASIAVIDALHDPLMLIDSGRRVVRANSAARSLFGERMVGRELAVSLRNPTLLDAVAGVLAGGASRSVEMVLPVPVERTLQARVKPFRLDTVEGPAVLLTLHDITLLKRSEQMRADFVANASHELRTPLAALIGFIETLRGPARDDAEARDRFLGIMFEQSNRMSRLVNDLLSLSRIEMDEHTPPTGLADLGTIVRTVVTGLELRAAARKVKLKIDGPGGLPPVQGDEDQLAQVFQNLIDNAIKYGKEQTEVTVSLALCEPAPGSAAAALPLLPGRHRAERMLRVSVTDRGEGIARTHLPRLTERFYRVDPARSRALGGTGLGLAIVKHIINRHRGRLTIDSEVGKGSTFAVHLPVATEEVVAAARAAAQ
ncbi:ATP-binding protein [Oleisolibacter albus]|uniref:ATP-binding protein n=1 Tax=Oleisolibacter albus TaxID=2171757 RepID=UPI000DF13E6F|nr:ATP-binding protein [Oleisolibacter albus]